MKIDDFFTPAIGKIYELSRVSCKVIAYNRHYLEKYRKNTFFKKRKISAVRAVIMFM